MTQMTVTIPKALAGMSAAEREALIREGLQEAVQARIRQIKTEIAESGEHIRRFEAKYGLPLEQFEKQLDAESMAAHEDYNEWFFWQNVLERNQQALAEMGVNLDH